MKTLIVISALSLVYQFSFGQGLKKDNLFGVHVITVSLKPDATIEEFKSFFVKEVLPEYKKHWRGLEGYLLKSARGEYKDSFAIMWLFESEKIRDSYFNSDGTPNSEELKAFEKVKPIEEKLSKYGTYTIKYMDDWVVQ